MPAFDSAQQHLASGSASTVLRPWRFSAPVSANSADRSMEGISIAVFLLWVVMLAIALLQQYFNALGQSNNYFSSCQLMSPRTGISFFTGMAKSDGGSILKSESVAGIVPVMRKLFPSLASCSGTCLYSAVCPAN
jgi:hypothetical protein